MNTTAEKFQIDAAIHIEALQKMIDLMPFKGDKESESQKICLQNALNEFEFNVNGLEDEDLKE